MTGAEPRQPISKIDPFSREYLKVAVKRSRAHYRDRYREIFDSFPARFKELGDRARDRYYRELARCWLAPENIWDPYATMRNGCLLATRGLQLARGLISYQDDQRVKRGEREPGNRWRLGENIAVTPKETVYESEVLKVYHYTSPQGDGRRVHRLPFVMFYSWINAYWILDLTPETSMMRALRDAGLDVYITDWQRPRTAKAFNMDLTGYMEQCRLAADAVRAHSGQQRLLVGGYCIGGVLADILVAQDPGRVAALVNLTTGIDTFAGEEGAGAFGAFTSFEIADLGAYAARHGGMLPQKEFAEFFDNVKPRKAVETFMDRFVYGQEIPDDPISYWNRRSARPVYPVHLEFLRRVYNDNELAEGTMSLGNGRIDLKRISQPLLVIMGQYDHIVPLPVALRTHHLVSTPPGDQESVLIQGGHVRAIVNDAIYPVIIEFLKRWAGERDRVAA